jgi:hypothetical protein
VSKIKAQRALASTNNYDRLEITPNYVTLHLWLLFMTNVLIPKFNLSCHYPTVCLREYKGSSMPPTLAHIVPALTFTALLPQLYNSLVFDPKQIPL